MSNIVTINNVQVERITYKDRPVVTIAQIAEVHGVSADTIGRSFRRNKGRFIEGEDYVQLDFTEASQTGRSVRVSHNGEIVFTENGYLLLVKPLRDDVSWQVQRRMRDAYFAGQPQPAPRLLPTAQERLSTLQACAAALDSLGVFDDRDKIEFGAYIRQVAKAEMQPLMDGSGTPALSAGPTLWTLSMRMQALGYPPLTGPDTTSLQIKLGSAAAKAYRTTYGEEPKKLWDYVKGQQRHVNAYLPDRLDIIDAEIAAMFGPPPSKLRILEGGAHG